MIEQLTIEGYRGFEKLTMEGLGRVNLLVGKNNAGKTSVLEAVRLLASGGGLDEMVRLALARGETISSGDGERGRTGSVHVDLSHFFHGHTSEPGARFSLKAGGAVAPFSVALTHQTQEQNLEGFDDPDPPAGALAIEVDRGTGLPLSGPQREQRLAADGSMHIHRGFRMTPLLRPKQAVSRTLSVPPDSLPAGEMSRLWSEAVLEGREGAVADAMRVVEPSVRDLFFVSGAQEAQAPAEGVLVGLNGHGTRVPLGSMGDGVRRMLALALSLSHARGGYLLVDEIDTGLHWSVMADMWKLVMQAAKDNGVQVFATTHSKDCLEALAEAVETAEAGLSEDEKDRPAVFQVTAGQPEALRYDAGEVRYALDTRLEIRGR